MEKDEEGAWRLARLFGWVVNLACNIETSPFEDMEASRIKANEAKANRNNLKQEKEQRDKDEQQGGSTRLLSTALVGTCRRR